MKYIKCDCCGKKIEFGSEILRFGGYCGIYCSAECYANQYADFEELNEELAENCNCKVFDDAEDEIRKMQIKNKIVELQHELEILNGDNK